MTTNTQPQAIFEIVIDEISALLQRPKAVLAQLPANSSMIADLGLDSITIVELAWGVEQRLGTEIAVNHWLGEEAEKAGDRFSIASFVVFIAQGGRSNSLQEGK